MPIRRAFRLASILMKPHPHLPNEFADLGINPALLEGLRKAGFETPTDIQREMIPLVLQVCLGFSPLQAGTIMLPTVLASVIGEDADCDASLRRIFGEDLQQAVDDLDRFINSLDVSTQASSYGVQRDEWRSLLTSALAGERGLNFIGTHERVMENFSI